MQRVAKNSKQKSAKTNSTTALSAAARACSVSYGADELLLVAKSFMKVSCNAKHSTDRKAEKCGKKFQVLLRKTLPLPTRSMIKSRVFSN